MQAPRIGLYWRGGHRKGHDGPDRAAPLPLAPEPMAEAAVSLVADGETRSVRCNGRPWRCRQAQSRAKDAGDEGPAEETRV